MSNKTFLVNIDNKIYLLRKNIYDYSTFNPDTNIINEVIYNSLNPSIKIINNNKLDNISFSSSITNEGHQYLYNDNYYNFKGTNLINNSDNKQYIIIEILNPDFIVNGNKIEILYYHMITHQHQIQKFLIGKYVNNISNLENISIIKTLINLPIVNYIELFYEDINNNIKRYIIIPELIYTNNIHYINYFVNTKNNLILDRTNYVTKYNSEKLYTHTFIILDLGFLSRVIQENTLNILKPNILEIKKTTTTLEVNSLFINELFYTSQIINENTNNTLRNTYKEYLKFTTLNYTSSILINENSIGN